MGYDLTTLKNLPKHLGYYFFLIGDYRNNALVNNFLREEFSIIASRLGEDAGIIRQTQKSKIEEELNIAISKHQFSGTNISNFFDSVSYQYPGLLILNKHPDDLTDKDTIIHIPFTTLNSVYSSRTDELLDDLVGFTKGNKQLLLKINKWVKNNKKIVSITTSIGINIGFFSINFDINKNS
jgi:hypothetical protein